MFLYQGEGIPPSNKTGESDPYIKFNFLGNCVDSDIIYSTYNPIWNQVLTLKLSIQDILSSRLEKGMLCRVIDK